MPKPDDDSRHGLPSILDLLLGPCYLQLNTVYLFIFQVCVLEGVRSLELELHVVVSHLMWELNFGERAVCASAAEPSGRPPGGEEEEDLCDTLSLPEHLLLL